MTDREFCLHLIRRLQDVDETCSICIYNPRNDEMCANMNLGICFDIKVCYEGMKKFTEKEQGDDKQGMA